DLVGDLDALEVDLLGLSGRGKTSVERGGYPGEAGGIGQRHAFAQRRDGDEPVERPAVEVMPAEPGRQPPADRALARAARAVDRHDWHARGRHRPPSASIRKPAAAATARKFGN